MVVGAEWWSQFSSKMSFAAGEVRTLAEEERGCVLADFTLPGVAAAANTRRKRRVSGGGVRVQPVN